MQSHCAHLQTWGPLVTKKKHDPWIRTKIAVLGRLNQGGFGDVHTCQLQGGFDNVRKDVVIKLARPGNKDAEENLKEEARVLSQLSCKNIVQMLDCGWQRRGDDWVAFLVLEHAGVSLAEIMRSMGGPFDPALATYIVSEVGQALGYAHEREIIHRDIKPANILVGLQGEVKVGDWGTARAPNRLLESTNSRFIKGTIPYVSPEQLTRRQRGDQRSDQWSLGVLLYELLTGRRPFISPSFEEDSRIPEDVFRLEVSRQIVQKPMPPLPASVPREVAVVAERMLQKNPEDRFPSMRDACHAMFEAGGLDPQIAMRELAHQAHAAEDAERSRSRNPQASATTVPVNAKERQAKDWGPTTAVKVRSFRVDESDSSWLDSAATALWENSDNASAAGPARTSLPGTDTEIIPTLPAYSLFPWRRWIKALIVLAVVALGVWAALLPSPAPKMLTEARSVQAAPVEAATTHAQATPPPGEVVTDDAPGPVHADADDVPPSDTQDQAGSHQRPEYTPTTDDSKESPPETRPHQASPPKAGTRKPRASKPRRGTLRIVTIPQGYASWRGGSARETPVVLRKLRPGSYTVRLGLRPDRLDHVERVTVSPGANTLHIELANPFAQRSLHEPMTEREH